MTLISFASFEVGRPRSKRRFRLALGESCEFVKYRAMRLRVGLRGSGLYPFNAEAVALIFNSGRRRL